MQYGAICKEVMQSLIMETIFQLKTFVVDFAPLKCICIPSVARVSMITAILSTLFGTKNEREIKRLRAIVERINNFEPKMQSYSLEELKNQAAKFKQQLSQGATLSDILPEAFATVREVSKRVINMRHYDVQLIGGMVLHEGSIAEMKTGEGKTLVATLPLYLNSLTGKGAHLVTVNDYLARRDAQWMTPLYEALGVSVGIIQSNMNEEEKKAAYNADITYGTNNEFGFDYLRDNMKFNLGDFVQRDLHFAIVDEVDSILIDEARTPLIISGPAEKSSKLYLEADQVVRRLTTEDYEVDEKARSVHLTDNGTEKAQKLLGIENLYAPEHTLFLHHINQALKAHVIFRRNVDYMVREDEVLIIDEFTGRILSGRRYSDGLHQALEAKEGVNINRENQTLATITLQNYFRMYEKLAGMTGTAATEAQEFHKIYKLNVISIPTNRPIARIDEPDAIFLTKEDKYNAIAEDIIEAHKKGQPVLVGTISVENSEYLSTLLSHKGLPHNVLNAKHHEREADIVSEAGHPGKITIATNMAGRGTDIKLTPEVLQNGGLRIIGTERHESRRIDNQLRGRAGRQGDPGSSKFYLSLEDDLIRIFGGDRMKNIFERLGMQPGERIEYPMATRSIERAQERVEKQHFEHRKGLLEYDDVINQQRKIVYAYRREILEGAEHTKHIIVTLIEDVITSLIPLYSHDHPSLSNSKNENDARAELYKALERLSNISIATFKEELGTLTSEDALIEKTIMLLKSHYENNIHNKIELEIIRNAEKWTLLELVDHHWKIHLYIIDSLKEGIRWRGYGQKNPLLEYKKEAFEAFTTMMDNIKIDSLVRLFRIDPSLFSEDHIEKIEQARERELEQTQEAGPDESGENELQSSQRKVEKVGRNELCPCGSGKKYKHCCG